MKVGYFSVNAAEGIRPGVLARELEDRGFDSLWLPEHSHIPVERDPVPPFGRSLPDAYLHIMDPFTSLAVAAECTTELIVATGVSMVLEHDLLDLACRVATLDVLSGGRVRLGVAVGWIKEELANHRPELAWSSRYAAVSERIAALRLLWQDDVAEFSGRWDRFGKCWMYPKPIQQPLPVGFGYSGPDGIEIAAREADEWYPVDAVLAAANGDLKRAIDRFRQLLTEADRDPEDVPISLVCWGWEPGKPSVDQLKRYGDLGVERVVVTPPTMERHNADITLRRLDEFAALL